MRGILDKDFVQFTLTIRRLPMFDVIQTVKADFSNYDDNSAWPYLLDEFVDHVKEQRAMS